MKFKNLLTTLFISSLTSFSSSAQEIDAEAVESLKKINTLNYHFSNLPEEQRNKYFALKLEAHRLTQKNEHLKL